MTSKEPPMHTLYFTRHGETVWNVENKICGMTDSPLTERGRQQARKLGEAVKASGVHIDEILYSPLSRAADTAMAIAEATGLPARCEPRLREQCFGKYEGTPRNGGEFRVSKTHFADRYDGGESMMQLAQRIYNLLDELKADTGKTYLLVAHNGIARVVQSYFYDMTNEEYAAAGIKNCELVEASNFENMETRDNKWDMPRLAVSLSDYNQMRKMAGLSPIELAEDEFALQASNEIDTESMKAKIEAADHEITLARGLSPCTGICAS